MRREKSAGVYMKVVRRSEEEGGGRDLGRSIGRMRNGEE